MVGYSRRSGEDFGFEREGNRKPQRQLEQRVGGVESALERAVETVRYS